MHQFPEEMGAAAGGVELFAGGHEAGAHGSGIGFAAGSDAYAAEGGIVLLAGALVIPPAVIFFNSINFQPRYGI